jgi:hypothetical protein
MMVGSYVFSVSLDLCGQLTIWIREGDFYMSFNIAMYLQILDIIPIMTE